jgi:NADH:ubiquinone oxidoreductase subunit 4 (subunit M)
MCVVCVCVCVRVSVGVRVCVFVCVCVCVCVHMPMFWTVQSCLYFVLYEVSLVPFLL